MNNCPTGFRLAITNEQVSTEDVVFDIQDFLLSLFSKFFKKQYIKYIWVYGGFLREYYSKSNMIEYLKKGNIDFFFLFEDLHSWTISDFFFDRNIVTKYQHEEIIEHLQEIRAQETFIFDGIKFNSSLMDIDWRFDIKDSVNIVIPNINALAYNPTNDEVVSRSKTYPIEKIIQDCINREYSLINKEALLYKGDLFVESINKIINRNKMDYRTEPIYYYLFKEYFNKVDQNYFSDLTTEDTLLYNWKEVIPNIKNILLEFLQKELINTPNDWVRFDIIEKYNNTIMKDVIKLTRKLFYYKFYPKHNNESIMTAFFQNLQGIRQELKYNEIYKTDDQYCNFFHINLQDFHIAFPIKKILENKSCCLFDQRTYNYNYHIFDKYFSSEELLHMGIIPNKLKNFYNNNQENFEKEFIIINNIIGKKVNKKMNSYKEHFSTKSFEKRLLKYNERFDKNVSTSFYSTERISIIDLDSMLNEVYYDFLIYSENFTKKLNENEIKYLIKFYKKVWKTFFHRKIQKEIKIFILVEICSWICNIVDHDLLYNIHKLRKVMLNKNLLKFLFEYIGILNSIQEDIADDVYAFNWVSKFFCTSREEYKQIREEMLEKMILGHGFPNSFN